jgi:uncharacterized protein involved in exopolysaccharide biosynthesis
MVSLQLSALTSATPVPFDLQLPLGALDVNLGSGDAAALAQAVDEARTALNAAAEAFPARLAGAQAAVQREQTAVRRLERAVTLAEERFQTLARKSNELEVAATTAGTELRLATPAMPPRGIDLEAILRDAGMALLLGLLAGTALAILWPSVRAARQPSEVEGA